MSKAVKAYIKAIEMESRQGNATEHTFRPAIKTLVETICPGIIATNEAKRVKCGAPDFVLTQHSAPIGYIETKDLHIGLDAAETTDQLKRYLESLPNLILTNYLEFRWYVNGNQRSAVTIGKPAVNGRLHSFNAQFEALETLLRDVAALQAPTIAQPKELAKRMARLAQMLRDGIADAFKEEPENGELHGQLEGFKQVLIHTLEPAQFADMVAQTIVYGLFAARCNQPAGTQRFCRSLASSLLPKTNPFLRKLFDRMAGVDLTDQPFAWVVDDLAEVLANADMGAILEDFGRRTRQHDPVVHFYETFLKEYDPKLRDLRGVYYTPEPVVSYIVRSVDSLLKTHFDLEDGLACTDMVELPTGQPAKGKGMHKPQPTMERFHKVQILDPAAGTGTFLHSVVDCIHAQYKDNQGLWSAYVQDHLLPRLVGFEFLMAPYAVAHMKMGIQLKETGYDFTTDERLHIYLTNTLEEMPEFARYSLFGQFFAEEARQAGRVKHDAPVMVILGNPPYEGHSLNLNRDSEGNFNWIGKLIEQYKKVNGQEIYISQPKWLQNDYVKFIAAAQDRIERTGYGILGFVTSHSYLDGQTHVGMRASLLSTFDEIYILDLHGFTTKEKPPFGLKDENVFDIKEGVAIAIYIKTNTQPKKQKSKASVYHYELWMDRDAKYSWLQANNVLSTPWKLLDVCSPNFLFIPQENKDKDEYLTFKPLPELFGMQAKNKDKKDRPSPGINTTQDDFAISYTREEMVNKVQMFLNTSTEAEARQLFKLCSQSQWSYEKAKSELSCKDWQNQLIAIFYRPFDIRWTVYNNNVSVHLKKRATKDVYCKENICLLTTCLTKGDNFSHVMATKNISETICLSSKTSCNAYVFPLYRYNPESEIGDTFLYFKQPSLNLAIIERWFKPMKLTWLPDGAGDTTATAGPEDVLAYVYAVLHSPTYRTRYAEYLKSDFPHIPLTKQRGLFAAMVTLGHQLIQAHLLEADLPLITAYPVAGSNLVEKVRYTPADDNTTGRVWINATQYFSGVPPQVWEFQVGGYQVCAKWLKDRKGRTLTFDELRHYQRTVAALNQTIALMAQVDEVITGHGGWPLT